MPEKQVESSVLAPFVVGRNILEMSHSACDEHDAPGHYGVAVTPCEEQLYLLRETSHQQLHLLERVHGLQVVMLLQTLCQHIHVLLQHRPVLIGHLVDIETGIYSFLCSANPQLTQFQWVVHFHHAAHAARC